ncbi:tail fiber assembly protein [Rahnella sp. ChDrAdgB13]|uniref:tail fiber assembly protein n=1 Tax=Rahnella sp. ChDrAdgB13 TaxID=1850581 RepID=UPI001AD854DA|nr:tail fiber assembly protein [Rahnella sp. ChDrAdgB13]
MKLLGKFSRYTPDSPDGNINYLRNEDGTDWYTISWDKERIAKSVYAGTDDTGKIIVVAENGALLFPVDMTVWEIDKDEAPENIVTEGYNASIVNGKYTVDYVSIAESKRAALLSDANAKISNWKAELMLETISDDDKASLQVWLTCIKVLKALDLSTAPDIEWPGVPQ